MMRDAWDTTELLDLLNTLREREEALADSEIIPFQQASRHAAAANVLSEVTQKILTPIDREAVHLVDDLV